MIATLPDNGRAEIILVDCGPGSFTGTRVGLAAALALGIAWGVPVHGFSTLALIAAGAEEEADAIGVAMHGGHSELFVQQFSFDPLKCISTIASLPAIEAAGFLDARLLVGSGAEAVRRARGHGLAREGLPRAADTRKLPEMLRRLSPQALYIRPPDAVAQ